MYILNNSYHKCIAFKNYSSFFGLFKIFVSDAYINSKKKFNVIIIYNDVSSFIYFYFIFTLIDIYNIYMTRTIKN